MNRWPRVVIAASALILAVGQAAGSTPPEFDAATRLGMKGDYEGAAKQYESFLDRSPNDRLAPTAVMAIANICLDARMDSVAAIAWLDRVVRDYPSSRWAPEAARAKGRCQESQGKWIDAGETYIQAIELAAKSEGTFSDRWINEVTLAAANSFSAAGDRPRQIATYRRVLDGSPPQEVAAASLYRLAESYEGEGDAKSAAENYARVIEEHPASPLFDAAMRKRPLVEQHVSLEWEPYARYAEGTGLVQRQDFAGALANTDALLATGVDPPLRECLEYRKITLETALTGSYTDGCSRLRAYIEQYPEGQRTEMARRTLEQNWGPIADLEAAALQNPEDPEAWNNLGLACVQARAGAKAVEALERAVALAPDDPDTHLNLGFAYSIVRRNEEAAKAFEFYLVRNPENETALNLIGYSYLGLRQPEKAIPYFERYVALAPEDPNSHDSLGEGYMTAGRLEEAAREYERALALNPTFSNSQFMVAGIYRQMGQTEKAIGAYRRFLELSPDGPQAEEARSAIEALEGSRQTGTEE